ncbi:hypothetical protein JTB14_017584 [Gonioctena quinquepunctata]|nr:hypothetical protein JTB14_017584 [Gonioctena quinquepunctata]
MIEDTYVCHNHLEPQADSCIATVIKVAENRYFNITRVQITNPITEAIWKHFVLGISAEGPLKIHKTCNDKKFLLIEGPSLIEVPYNCGIVIDDFRIWNKREIVKRYPLTLRQIWMTKYNQEYSEVNLIRLHSIDITDPSFRMEPTTERKLVTVIVH